MTKIIKLPNNFIGKEDREKLESFARHTIARGRATRWYWGRNAEGDDQFAICSHGADLQLAVTISRDRKQDEYYARDTVGDMIAQGAIEHLFAELEVYFIRLLNEQPDTPA
jgi:hypothetical protein